MMVESCDATASSMQDQLEIKLRGRIVRGPARRSQALSAAGGSVSSQTGPERVPPETKRAQPAGAAPAETPAKAQMKQQDSPAPQGQRSPSRLGNVGIRSIQGS